MPFYPTFSNLYLRHCFLLILIISCYPGRGFGTSDYVIELHSAGHEEIAGYASLEKTTTKTIDAVVRKTSETTQYSIDAHFYPNEPAQSTLSYRPFTQHFFMSSLFDHIWALSVIGERRHVRFLQRYPQYSFSYERVSRVKKPVCCFCLRRSEEIVEKRAIATHYKADLVFHDVVSGAGSQEKATLEWDINSPESDDDGCTHFLYSFLQKITSSEGTHTRSPISNDFQEPLKLLTPFSHGEFRGKLLELNAPPVIFHDEHFVFLMDWLHAATVNDPVTSVSIQVSAELLQLYEYRQGGTKKKEEPDIFNRYVFMPAAGSMDLIIWGNPGEMLPWAWEYREKSPAQRVIRFLRILPGDGSAALWKTATNTKPVVSKSTPRHPKKRRTADSSLTCIVEEPSDCDETIVNTQTVKLFELFIVSVGLPLLKAGFSSGFIHNPDGLLLH